MSELGFNRVYQGVCVSRCTRVYQGVREKQHNGGMDGNAINNLSLI